MRVGSVEGVVSHYPVMLPEVLAYMRPVDGGVYVDGTFGAGGYTCALLSAADCRVCSIDRDEDAVVRADAVKAGFGDRFVFMRGCFGDVEHLLSVHGVGKVDGFVLDVGVSSMQIDEAERGFSFRFDAPLDMRMDRSSGLSAADVVNGYEEEDLANVIYQYGEERHSRRIARRIVQVRAEKPLSRTIELADVVRSVLPRKSTDKIDPATRTFQALRIVVNDELGELQRALEASLRILRPGGRLVVVSFHSLEDGLVKRFLQERSAQQDRGSRHLPAVKVQGDALFTLPVRRAVKPSEEEVLENPRSRSARLRVAVRTRVPVDGGCV